VLQMNQVLAFIDEKLKRFCLKFDNVFKNLACCVFFTAVSIFERIFKKTGSLVFFGFFGRFSFFCRNTVSFAYIAVNIASVLKHH
jgi:hypothetical protein